MKRLDLIFSERELSQVLEALNACNVPGYSVMKHVTGRGDSAGSAVSEDMEFTGLGANAHVIVFCNENLIDPIREKINPVLDYYGGVAYLSEASPLN